jgi:flagellar L-ring protein precursor FlgH
MKHMVSVLTLAALLSGCGAVGRLSTVGKPPKMSPLEEPASPMLEPSLGSQAAAHRSGRAPVAGPATASLFRTGAGAFLRDQRASRVGDIVTIRINIADRAVVDNSTSRSRAGGETANLSNLLGLESQIGKILPGNPNPASLVNTGSTSQATGSGNTARSEQISLTIAAVVTDVLPNGNLLIRGRQETRVNFELRELIVSGVIRPEDIARDNSIQHSQIAEARISYGGHGQLTDAQQARWGQQIYDALFPF